MFSFCLGRDIPLPASKYIVYFYTYNTQLHLATKMQTPSIRALVILDFFTSFYEFNKNAVHRGLEHLVRDSEKQMSTICGTPPYLTYDPVELVGLIQKTGYAVNVYFVGSDKERSQPHTRNTSGFEPGSLGADVRDPSFVQTKNILVYRTCDVVNSVFTYTVHINALTLT